jgi:DNA-binding SARP family transcriptional activator
VLGRDVVARRGPGYALVVEPDAVDAHRLEHLIEQARAAADGGDHRGAAQHYRSALALVRGPILGDLLDHPAAREAAARLEEIVLAAEEGLADAELAAGRHAEVVARLTELAREHPLRERFSAQLVTALYRCGRQVDALRAYAQVREALIEEFGVEPGQELRDLEQAVLAHDPALAAPASAMAATSAAPQPLSAGEHGDPFHQTPDRLPLIGREHELGLLRADLDDALVGRGRVALLVGEPGIGKTRLAEEIASEAEPRGTTIGWGRSHDDGGAVAFWSWIQVVRTLIERAPRDLVVAALGRRAAEIAQVVPEVHDLVADLDPPPALDPDGARFRVCDALTSFLRNLARARPLLITIDDVQWADPASLQMLSFLAREITDAPLLVVVTYRSVGAPADDRLGQTLALLVRQPIARRIDLDGLDRDALGKLVVAAGGDPSEAVLTTVHRRTQGNPFFAVEILRLLPERGDLDDVDAVRQAVPSGVREVIRQRLQLLPASTAGVLATAAVLGRDVDLVTLAAATSTPVADLLDQLEPAIDAGIVIDAEGRGCYRFSHGLVSETVYGDLSTGSKARVHRRVAEALESLHGDVDGPLLLDIASHWLRASPAAPPEKAIEWAVRAAAWTEAHLAHEQALTQLGNALDLLASLPAGRDRDVRELGILDQLSLLQIVTVGYASDEVTATLARMRELCRAIDEPELLVPVLWRLSISFCIAMQLDTAIELGEQLLSLAGPDDTPAPALAGHMALGTILTHRGEIPAARAHLDTATEMLDAGHGSTLIGVVAETPAVWVGAFSAWNWWLRGEEERAERLVLDTVAEAERAGAAYGTSFALWFSVLISTLRRDPGAVLERSERALEVSTANGFGMFVPYMLVSRGWAQAVEGDIEHGCGELAEAELAIRASGARMMNPVFPAFHADARLAGAQHAEALDLTEQGLADVEATGERWFEAELHRLRGVALAGIDPSDPDVVDALRRAIEIADVRGTAVLRRRAEESLALLEAGAPLT